MKPKYRIVKTYYGYAPEVKFWWEGGSFNSIESAEDHVMRRLYE